MNEIEFSERKNQLIANHVLDNEEKHVMSLLKYGGIDVSDITDGLKCTHGYALDVIGRLIDKKLVGFGICHKVMLIK